MRLSFLLVIVWACALTAAIPANRRFESARERGTWYAGPAERSPAWMRRTAWTCVGVVVLIGKLGGIRVRADHADYRRELDVIFERMAAEERARREARAAHTPADVHAPVRVPRDRDAQDE